MFESYNESGAFPPSRVVLRELTRRGDRVTNDESLVTSTCPRRRVVHNSHGVLTGSGQAYRGW